MIPCCITQDELGPIARSVRDTAQLLDVMVGKNRMLRRDQLRLAVAAKMAELGINAILYPLQQILAVAAGEMRTG